ncbi:MAG: hypothetical protein JWO10_920 [Microbacteriaceae bacterium]|nr:hypothetical protein [Microbacteriaceae bacterium]
MKRNNPRPSPTPRNPGDRYLAAEIERDRKAERRLIPKALLSLAMVAVLVVIRQVFFQ